MQKIYFLVLAIVMTLHLFAASKSCNPLYTNGSWLKKAGVTTKIDGIKLQSGYSLKSGKKSDLYFTKYFIKESGLNLSSLKTSINPFSLHTYRYHQPDTQIAWYLPSTFTNQGGRKIRSHRGGGRDHILSLDTALAIKGSGTNKLFSQSNHKNFDLKNFRRNGLMLLEDGLITYILAKQMKSLSMNVIDIPDLILADESIQKLVNKDSKKTNYVVQLHRDMSNARESMENLKQPNENHHHKAEGVYQLASDMLLFNIAHGAINPENMGYAGQIMDLGHVSFGYPMMSYNYRCTLCQGMQGGSADKTLIGILDHYFGNNLYSSSLERSYSFKLRNTDINQILQKTVHRLNRNKLTNVKVTRKESTALRRLFNEKVKLWGNLRTDLFYDEVLTKEFQNLYSTNIDKGVTYTFPDGELGDDFGGDLDLPIDDNLGDGLSPTQGNLSEDQWLSDNDLFAGEDHPVSFSSQDTKKSIERTNSWDYMWPVHKSLSYRFLWRVSAQKLYLSPSSYRQFKYQVQNLITPESRSDFETILNLFEKITDQSKLTRNDFKKVFQEFMPSNLLKFHIDEMISNTKSHSDIIKNSQTMLEELSKPISLSAKNFRELIKRIEKEFSIKKHEYLEQQRQKSIDKVNHLDDPFGDELNDFPNQDFGNSF